MSDEEETRAQRLDALLEDSLAATLDLLGELPESPKVRDLRAKVETYRRAIERWATVPPGQGQRDALRELVLELETRARDIHTSEMPTPHQGVPSVRPAPKG
ncbi:MAG TPA: hypothetical protein VGI39_31540 [Polyangiaceae bacterium]|jgi:hypothetical protein